MHSGRGAGRSPKEVPKECENSASKRCAGARSPPLIRIPAAGGRYGVFRTIAGTCRPARNAMRTDAIREAAEATGAHEQAAALVARDLSPALRRRRQAGEICAQRLQAASRFDIVSLVVGARLAQAVEIEPATAFERRRCR